MKASLAKRKRKKPTELIWHQPGQSLPEGQCSPPSIAHPLHLATYLDPTFLFHSTMANIICTIIFGQRFNCQDPRFPRLLHLMNDLSTSASSFYNQLRPKFPWWARNWGGWTLGRHQMLFVLTLRQEVIKIGFLCTHLLAKRSQVRQCVQLPRENRFWELLASSLEMFELLSGILKPFSGIHTQVYNEIQDMEHFVTENIERHQ